MALAVSASGCVPFDRKITTAFQTEHSVSDPAFRRAIGDLLETPLLEGNRIEALINGDQIFPAMLEAIRNAKKTITFENWSWQSGELSDRFIEALSERARAGVKVHVILDALGAFPLGRADEQKLRRAGVEWVKYNRIWKLWWIQYRTHRKLLIVDGRIAFTGGICIGDAWLGNADSPRRWRDTQYQVEGPAVRQMQRVFMDNWSEKRGTSLEGDAYFPDLKPAGSSLAHCFMTDPKDRKQSARLVYLYSIAAARKHIRLAQSYFLPDDLVIYELLEARKRGVRVEIITPGIIDWNVVRRASRSRWDNLMKAGVEFYEYQPALYHCKIMIVDDVWVSFGSVNFDDRSFYVNDEANVNVWDPDFAAEQVRIFEQDKAQSTRLTWEEFRRRSCWTKCLEKFAGLFRSQL